MQSCRHQYESYRKEKAYEKLTIQKIDYQKQGEQENCHRNDWRANF